MDQPTDRVPASAQASHELPPPAILALGEPDALDLHRQINARRAELENPELLRRIRAL